MLLQATGSNWDLRTLLGERAFWAVIIAYPAALIGLVLYLRRRDRRRKLARQPKAGN